MICIAIYILLSEKSMCFTNRSNLESNRSLQINPVKDSKIVFFMYNISIEADECFLCQVVVGEEHQCETLTKWISITLKQFCWSAHLPLICFVRKITRSPLVTATQRFDETVHGPVVPQRILWRHDDHLSVFHNTDFDVQTSVWPKAKV